MCEEVLGVTYRLCEEVHWGIWGVSFFCHSTPLVPLRRIRSLVICLWLVLVRPNLQYGGCRVVTRASWVGHVRESIARNEKGSCRGRAGSLPRS